MTKPNTRYYFREKRLAPRQKFAQKYLRPLAAWIEAKGPDGFLIPGILVFTGWSMLRLAFTHFYMAMTILPIVILAIAVLGAVTSWALRRGRHGSSD